MSLGSTIRSWFAAPPLPQKPAADVSDGAQAKATLGETGWSESLVYAKSKWPKYNPDELMGLKGARVYRKMMTDEQVKAVVRFKRDAITGRKWFFEFDAKDLLAANKEEDADPSAPIGGGKAPLPIAEKEKPAPKMRAQFYVPPTVAPEQEVDAPLIEEALDPATGLPATEEESGALSEEQELRIRVFEQVIDQMDGSFFDALNSIMTAVPYGFSMTEKVQKDIEVDGKTWVGIKRLALKPFDTFLFSPDEYGNIAKTIQRFEGYEQTIDMERFIHYVQNADVDAQYGQSELREAYRAWFSKDIAIRFWNIFLERYASGFLKIQPKDGVKVTSGSAEHTALVNLLTNLGPKTGVLLPSGVEAELIYPATTDAYEKAIASHDKSIAKALLVPNLMGISEQGQTGSYSQSQTQLEAFMWTLEAETNRLEEILNEHLFRPLGELNFGAGPYPRFCFKPLSEAMKMQIIKTWVELVKAKAVTSTDADEEHIRELLDFPEAGEPLEISAPSAAGVAIDPATGKPMLPAPGAVPFDPANMPSDKKKPIGKGDKRPGETVIGAKRIKAEHKVTFLARAVKRVDFAVIDNRGTKITVGVSAKVHEALRTGIDAMKEFIRTEDLFKNPDKIADVAMSARVMTRVRKATEAGLKEAWDLGSSHARRELEKAQSARFAADELRLADAAAQKFLEARSYSIAGDLADGARKKVTTILYNGIKGGWALEEILDRIEEELGATVLPHASTAIRTAVFEAINEARYELFASPEMSGFIEALEFSAILDGRTTEICEHMDERIYPVNDPVWEGYTPPLHFNALVTGTPILTERGWLPIERVEPGSKVWTHRSRWREVYTLMGKESDQPTIRELHLSTGQVVRITNEHPVLTTHGWCVAGDLKVGDVLFEHSEQVQRPGEILLPDPNYFPALTDEPSVAWDIVRSAPLVPLAVDFQSNPTRREGEVDDVLPDAMLKRKRHRAGVQNLQHDCFGIGRSVTVQKRETAARLFAQTIDGHGVMLKHAVGMGCSPSVCFLSSAPSPMLRSSGFKRDVAIGDGALRFFGSNRDAVPFTPSGKNGLPNSKTALDSANRFIVNPMATFNHGAYSGFISKVHKSTPWKPAAIITIADVKSNLPVWNLAVRDDETYVASGVIVHNCRSLLVAVTIRDTWERSDDPSLEPMEGFGGA